MAIATDLQVQTFVNERIRIRCLQIRALQAAMLDDIASIDDVYSALTKPSPTWLDVNDNGPPHLMTPSDVLAVNQFLHDISGAIAANGQYPIILKSCPRGLQAPTS